MLQYLWLWYFLKTLDSSLIMDFSVSAGHYWRNHMENGKLLYFPPLFLVCFVILKIEFTALLLDIVEW